MARFQFVQFPRAPRAIAVVAGTLLLLALVPANGALADEPTYPTRNGPKTESGLRTELQKAGYQGPWDLASELNAYDRAAAPWPVSPATPAPASGGTGVPAPTLEQLPVIFAGGPGKYGQSTQQVGPEFSLAGGDYTLAWSGASGIHDTCQLHMYLAGPGPEQPNVFNQTGSAPRNGSNSGSFAVPDVQSGAHYKFHVYSDCVQWTLRLTR